MIVVPVECGDLVGRALLAQLFQVDDTEIALDCNFGGGLVNPEERVLIAPQSKLTTTRRVEPNLNWLP